RRRFISRNVPSRCIFFFKTRSAALTSLSRTNTCIEPPTSLVVATFYAASQKGGAAPCALPLARRLGRLQVHRGRLALFATLKLEADALALMEIAHAGALATRNVDKHVLGAVLRLNEPVACLGIEPL